MQHQRRAARVFRAIWSFAVTRVDFGIQGEIQMDRLDVEIGRLIVGKMDGAGFFGAHANLKR